MITIRAAEIEDAPGIVRVHVDSWRTTYAGIVPADYLANLSYQRRTTLWEDVLRNAASRQQFAFVAENEALGGTYLKSAPFEIGGVTIEEVAYGWEDIRVIVR
jgi:hypothetical protein